MTFWRISRRASRSPLLAALALLLGAGEGRAEEPVTIDPARLSEIVKTLASDEFAGRAPGGPGEARTVEYLIRQFKEAGLEPAGEKGGWTQKVPLVHFQVQQDATVNLFAGGQDTPLRQGQEVVVNTLRSVSRV